MLVSEVMLQQTQAGRVAAAYPAFLERFPSAETLASAPAEDVLRAWAGLGYNRRALNLWRAAAAVVERGGFPRTVDELERLPGVGPYTARAVAAFAFGVDAAAVDANVRRILTRLHGRRDLDVQGSADRLLPPGRAGAFNQAMMDLGATVCRPRLPDCGRCPLPRWCAWAAGRRPGAKAPSPRTPFEETSRYARGRIVDALRAGPLRRPAVAQRTGLHPRRVEEALEALIRDGLAHVRGGSVRLGPQPSARSRSGSGSR